MLLKLRCPQASTPAYPTVRKRQHDFPTLFGCASYQTRAQFVSTTHLTPLRGRVGTAGSSTNIFIGENIAIALAQELDDRLPPKQLAYLNKQYELRLDRGEQYFALVKTPKDAFLATLPPPGYFASLSLPRLAEFYPANSEDGEDTSSRLKLLPPEQSSNSSPQSSQSSTIGSDPRNLAQNAQKCPQCDSTKFVKNGKKRGLQYYRCSNCKHQFHA